MSQHNRFPDSEPSDRGFPPAPAQNSDAAAFSAWRQQVRDALLKTRANMPVTSRIAAQKCISQKLADILATSEMVPEKSCVGFYWPVQGEIDVRNVIVGHIAQGGSACLPVVVARHQPMVFHRWTPQTTMKAGFAGIDVPAHADPVLPDVILAPLVGFDRNGYRLGYGGGFFDRTLAAFNHRPVVIGVGFASARLNSIFPHQYDVPVDILITETGMSRFS